MKHAYEPRHMVARDILRFGEKDDPAAVAEFERKADEYFKIFAAPTYEGEGDQKQEVCFHCGSPLDSFKQLFGYGAAIEWAIVHGEGNCSGMRDRPCGWPYRGMHYAKDEKGEELFTLRNVFLAYHPDGVSERKPEKAA